MCLHTHAWTSSEHRKRSIVGLCYIIIWQARANIIIKCSSVNASLLGTKITEADMCPPTPQRKWCSLEIDFNYQSTERWRGLHCNPPLVLFPQPSFGWKFGEVRFKYMFSSKIESCRSPTTELVWHSLAQNGKTCQRDAHGRVQICFSDKSRSMQIC